VRITNEKGERLAVLRSYAGGDTEGWQHHTVDLSRFAGRTVYLDFRVRTDPALLTTFYLDNVALERGSGPAARP
jgi:bacillopeptidase F (M6 metalloprotease family)